MPLTQVLCHVPVVAVLGRGRASHVNRRQSPGGDGVECTAVRPVAARRPAPVTATTSTRRVIPPRLPRPAAGFARPRNWSVSSAEVLACGLLVRCLRQGRARFRVHSPDTAVDPRRSATLRLFRREPAIRSGLPVPTGPRFNGPCPSSPAADHLTTCRRRGSSFLVTFALASSRGEPERAAFGGSVDVDRRTWCPTG